MKTKENQKLGEIIKTKKANDTFSLKNFVILGFYE
jgi:hypothetical protein